MIAETVCKQRKAAVLAILTEGLPPMPHRLRRLAALLAANPVDLKQVGSVIREDRHLTSWLSRWSEPFRSGQPNRVKRVEEAAILMGTARLKNLIFANYLILLTGDRLRRTDIEEFWAHALATAALSEALARAVGYDDSERVYLGGLMHDSGKLPLLMAAAGEAGTAGVWSGGDNRNSLQIEREHFGFDHCQVGRGLGITWNYDPGLIEVLERHHEPEKARVDPDLVGIIAAADHFLDIAGALQGPSPFAIDGVYRCCFPRLRDEELEDMVSLLAREYARVRRQTEIWSPEHEPRSSTAPERTGE
ncbi:MAG TPA: HDOD domain-containing protein [Patescibacteria group bacterium]|nr:HDOD domain-containing protein [Patescibacteria group bacterium]